MRLTDSKRRWVLGVLLCATLAATAWLHQNDNEAPQVVSMAHAQRMVSSRNETADTAAANDAIPTLDLQVLQARKAMEESDDEVKIDPDLFAAKSWVVAPPPSPKAELKALPPPAAVAPPLPFTYAGSMEDGGHLVVYLTKGERAYSVSVGDTLEGSYRVESMDSGQMVFTYLPMSIKQTLRIGS